MSTNHKSYRVKIDKIGGEPYKLNFNMNQSFDLVDILSLKLDQTSFYKTHSADYGCVVGRVLANGGVGVPNAKISCFIETTDEVKEHIEKSILYPYGTTSDKNYEQIQYNLLPDEMLNDCHALVGTMFDKRMILDNDVVLEVYDEFYKFSTVTNNAGDYMLFGLPVGNQTIHCDVDLSDCGMLSQKPRDMFYQGYGVDMFENASQFKTDTNLNNLAQLINQNLNVQVYPFWGDLENGENAITRCDIDVSYKFESTCLFIGSTVTDPDSTRLIKTCLPQQNLGVNNRLITKNGTIEMIRKTFDGVTEYFQIKGNQLIDGSGVWAYQIPMNLDYVITNEYGDLVPTDDINKGIATTAKVRFRINLDSEYNSGRRRASYLVPHNPLTKDDVDFEFGENTLDFSYTLLMKNKVYSVKSYIPRLQSTKSNTTRSFTGIKQTTSEMTNNPFPFNKMYLQLNFVFSILCSLSSLVIWFVSLVNTIISKLANFEIVMKLPWPIGKITFLKQCTLKFTDCITLNGWCTISPYSDWVFVPGCNSDCVIRDMRKKEEYRTKHFEPDDEILRDCVISGLAMQFEVYKLDFYNQWINGCLYYPVVDYIVRKKTKRKWLGLFGPKKVTEQILFCGVTNDSTNNAAGGGLFTRGIASFRYYDSFQVPSTASKDDRPYINYSDGFTIAAIRGNEKTQYRVTDEILLQEGIVNKAVQPDETYFFYYRPYNKKMDLRLFSTDIIMIGSLNDCDIDGIPALHKFLPVTSHNAPTIMYEISGGKELEEGGEPSYEEVGEYLALSGMNWGKSDDPVTIGDQLPNKTGDTYPDYSKGVFFGIDCFSTKTIWKSRINCERCCELNVGMDMQDISYPNCKSGKVMEEEIKPPLGIYIQRTLVRDNEARMMFATLNSIPMSDGIDPATAKDEKPYHYIYTDEHGTKKYNFHYYYPVNFDGWNYTNLIGQTHKNFVPGNKQGASVGEEYYDDDYYKFLFGNSIQWKHYGNDDEGQSSKEYNPNYYHSHFRLPKYKNSFYFYFGLVPGQSAIEQFRTKFYSDCVIPTNQGMKVSVEIIRHAFVCALCKEDLPGVEFNVTVKDFDGSYSLRIENTGEKIIPLMSKEDEVCYDEITDNKEKLVFKSVDDGKAYDYMVCPPGDPTFNYAGSYNLIVTDSSGKSVTNKITIRPEYQISFTGRVAKQIFTDLSENQCIEEDCKNNPGAGDCKTGVCCYDYIIPPEEQTNVNLMKGQYLLDMIKNTTIKGCPLCNYKLTITRKIVIGKGLKLELATSSGKPTKVKIISPGTKWIVCSKIPLPGGADGFLNIKKIDGHGGVITAEINASASSMAAGYESGVTDIIKDIEVIHSVVEYMEDDSGSKKKIVAELDDIDTGWITDPLSSWSTVCGNISDGKKKPLFEVKGVNGEGGITSVGIAPDQKDISMTGFVEGVSYTEILSDKGSGAYVKPLISGGVLGGFEICDECRGLGYAVGDQVSVIGFNAIGLFCCDGRYTVRLDNITQKGPKKEDPPFDCEDDFYETTFDLLKRDPIDIVFFSKIKSNSLRIKGADICEKKQDQEDDGKDYDKLTNEGGCMCDEYENEDEEEEGKIKVLCKTRWFVYFTTWLQKSYDDQTYADFIRWYRDDDVDEDNYREFIDAAKNTFISLCEGYGSLILSGVGYNAMYKLFTYGAIFQEPKKNPKKYAANITAYREPLKKKYDKYLYFANDSMNKSPEVDIEIPNGDNPIKLTVQGFDIMFSTNQTAWEIGINDYTAGLTMDEEFAVQPDGHVFTLTVWDPELDDKKGNIPEELKGKYEKGGYFGAVIGDDGKMNANRPGLSNIVSARDLQAYKPWDAYKLKKYITDKKPKGLGIETDKKWLYEGQNLFFYYHIIDRQLKILLEYSRLAAYHKNYIRPDGVTQSDIKGYFDIYYRNGPDTDLYFGMEEEREFQLEISCITDPNSVFTDNWVPKVKKRSYKLCHYGDENNMMVTGVVVDISGVGYMYTQFAPPSKDAEINPNGVKINGQDLKCKDYSVSVNEAGNIVLVLISLPIPSGKEPPKITFGPPTDEKIPADQRVQATAHLLVGTHDKLLKDLEGEYEKPCLPESLPVFRHFYSKDDGVPSETCEISIIYREVDKDGTVGAVKCDITKVLQFNLEALARDINVTTHIGKECLECEAEKCESLEQAAVYNTFDYEIIGTNSDVLDMNIGVFSWYKVRIKTSKGSEAGTGCVVRIFTRQGYYGAFGFLDKYIIIVKTGTGYSLGDLLRVMPGNLYVRVMDITSTGGIKSLTQEGNGIARGYNGKTGYATYNTLLLRDTPKEVTGQPEEVLYFPWYIEDLTKRSIAHVNFPYFTHRKVESLIPPIASRNYIDVVDKEGETNKLGIGAENVTPDAFASLSAYIAIEDFTPKLKNDIIQKYPGPILQDTDEIYYYIIHDELTNMRAFSQPMDFSNYIRVNQDNIAWDFEENNLIMTVEVYGRNAFVKAGYYYELEEGYVTWEEVENYNADWSENKTKIKVVKEFTPSNYIYSAEGIDTYYTTDTKEVEMAELTGYTGYGMFIEAEITKAGCGYVPGEEIKIYFPGGNGKAYIKITPDGDGCIPAGEVKFTKDGKGAGYKWRSKYKLGIINSEEPKKVAYHTFYHLQFDVKDYNKVIRVRVRDCNGVVFTNYTSVYRFINQNPKYTYCMYNCNNTFGKHKGFILNLVVNNLTEKDVVQQIDWRNGDIHCVYIGTKQPNKIGENEYQFDTLFRLFKPGKIFLLEGEESCAKETLPYPYRAYNYIDNISFYLSDGTKMPDYDDKTDEIETVWKPIKDGVTIVDDNGEEKLRGYDHVGFLYVAIVDKEGKVQKYDDGLLLDLISIRTTDCIITYTMNMTFDLNKLYECKEK